MNILTERDSHLDVGAIRVTKLTLEVSYTGGTLRASWITNQERTACAS